MLARYDLDRSSLTTRVTVPEPTTCNLERSLTKASLRGVEAKAFLFAEGDPVSHVYRVETGAIALFKVLADGRRQVLGFAYPGDLIGLGIAEMHAMNAQAVKPTRVRCLSVKSVRQLASRDPALSFRLFEALARELAATRELMFTTGHRSAAERVAGFLMACSRRKKASGNDPTAFELPMTRVDIGDLLGLTIETVSRTLTRLRHMGLIALPSYDDVRILAIQELEKLAAGDDRGCANGSQHAKPKAGVSRRSAVELADSS
jgi:CRP/FNR family transcriptional regulator